MKQNNTQKNSLGQKKWLNTGIEQTILIVGALILAGLFGLSQLQDVTSDRVTDGLVVLYDFQEGRGDVVRDMSEVGTAMNLTIADEDDISWLTGGGLSINSSTIIQSSGAATKIIDAIQATEAITIEAWVRPMDDQQNGPARIVSLSESTSQRNFTLGQQNSHYKVRFRTSETTVNGMPELSSADNIVNTTSPQHIVYTLEDEEESLYINGTLVKTGERIGDLGNWGTTMGLAIGNELTEDREWLGEVYLIAVYEKAIAPDEVSQNYQHGVDNLPYFEAIVSSLPGQTASGWATFDESESYEIETIGMGWHGEGSSRGISSTISIPISNPETVSHILVETVTKGGSPSIIYTTALGSVSPSATDVPKAGTSTVSFKVHRSLLAGDPSVSSIDVTTTDSDKTESVTAVVFREGDGQQNSLGLYVSESFYRNSNTYTLSIPTATEDRNLTITIPVSEMSNDSRYAILTATAGTVTQTQTISTYDPLLGRSLRMVTLSLESVPGSVSEVQIKVESPSSNGDSFAVGGAIEVNVEPTNTNFPVEWTYFEVESVGDAAHLKWGTAIEINSDNFMVERSIDGVLFQNISSVKAAGTTDQAQAYQYQDNTVNTVNAPVVYYRLRQVDIDGSFTYSKVQEYKSNLQATLSLNAYPNPATDVLNIEYQSNGTADLQFQIVNLAGQVMEQQILPSGKDEIQVSVQTWPKGNYYIRLFNEENEETFQVVKQ